nr:hypothetical protein [Tanacetum cinerariifolium]
MIYSLVMCGGMFKKILSQGEALKIRRVILFGDLNEVRSELKRFSSTFSYGEDTLFNSFIYDNDLTDHFTDDNVKEKWAAISDLEQSKPLYTKLKDLKSHLKLWYAHTIEVEANRINFILATLDKKIDDGHATDDIKSTFLDFYKDKFSCHDSVIAFLLILPAHRLSIVDLDFLESMVSMGESKATTSVAVKKVNDIMRLQALVDKKRVIITEATIRDALCLDDAEGVECLPNEEIFAELARMGYEKPLTKLTFYKAFFSSQWKFLIHTILQCMNAKRTSWNEFSSFMASAVICLSTGRKFNFSKYIFDSLVRNVDSSTKVYMYLRFLQLLIRKQVGDLSSHTTKYSSPALTQKVFANMRWVDVPAAGVATEGAASVPDDEVLDAVTEPSIPSPTPPTPPPQPLQDNPSTSQDKITQALVITKLKQRVKKLERKNKAFKLKRLKKDVTLKDVIVVAKDVQDAEIEEIIRDTKESATPSTIIHSEAKSKDKGKGILVEEPKPLKMQAQIEQDEACTRELEAELNKNIDWDEVIDHVQRKQKKDNVAKRYQALKRKPQTEAQASKNMMIYLRNTKEQMDEEDSRALKRLGETQEEKAAKKQKLDEEIYKLKFRKMKKSVHGQAKVKSWKLLESCEEESEVSLELLRFISVVFKSEEGGGGRGVKEKSANATNLEVVKDDVVSSVTVSYGNTQKDLNDDPVAMEVQSSSGNRIDVVSMESILDISEIFTNTAYGFFLGKRMAYPIVANYVRNMWGKFRLVRLMFSSSAGLLSFKFSSMDGLNSMLENGPYVVFKSEEGGGGRGVNEKSANATNLEVVKDDVVSSVTVSYGNTQKDLNDDPVAMEVQSSSVDLTNAVKTGRGSCPPLPTQGTKTPLGNRIDVVSMESILDISEIFTNTAYGFFFGKRMAYPIVANYVECPKNLNLGTRAGETKKKKTSQAPTGVQVEHLDDHDSEDKVASVDNVMARSLALKRTDLALKVCWNNEGILMVTVTMMKTHTMTICVKAKISLKRFKQLMMLALNAVTTAKIGTEDLE